MSGATFDTETLRLMTAFENTTHANVKDCVSDSSVNCIYIVVQEGEAGTAIGKNGINVKRAKDMLKKEVKIFEFSSDLKKFVKNLIPQVVDVNVKEEGGVKTVEVRVENGSKPMVIGRERRNIKLFKELLRRNHDVDDLVIR